MGDLSKNFSRSEHACSCRCGFDTVDVELNAALQELHDDLSRSWGIAVRIQITGGNRCFERNELVQLAKNPDYVPGSSQSTHMEGKAADIKVYFLSNKGKWVQVKPQTIYELMDKRYPTSCGVGNYKTFTHFDVRAIKARF